MIDHTHEVPQPLRLPRRDPMPFEPQSFRDAVQAETEERIERKPGDGLWALILLGASAAVAVAAVVAVIGVAG